MGRKLFGALYRLYIRYTMIGFEKRSNNNVKPKHLQRWVQQVLEKIYFQTIIAEISAVTCLIVDTNVIYLIYRNGNHEKTQIHADWSLSLRVSPQRAKSSQRHCNLNFASFAV